jgi:hypothetical protein
MLKGISYFFFIIIVSLSSCAKDQNQIRGTWNIQSVLFNGEEKMNDPSLMGIVKYEGSYDYDWRQSYYGGDGGMMAKNSNNEDIFFIYIHFDNKKNDTIDFGYSPWEPRPFGSYLPGMIDTLPISEHWRILQLTNRKFSIQFAYKGNTYEVDMKKE